MKFPIFNQIEEPVIFNLSGARFIFILNWNSCKQTVESLIVWSGSALFAYVYWTKLYCSLWELYYQHQWYMYKQSCQYSTGLYSVINLVGAQWLSGRVLDLRPRGSGFKPHWRHCVVVFEQDTFILA